MMWYIYRQLDDYHSFENMTCPVFGFLCAFTNIRFSELLKIFLKIRSSRLALFKQELAEREELDVLDRASLKAHHSKINGVLSAPEYHRIIAKIDSLKKLRFTEDYERLQDPATYEWMKYKVAAEVGGHEEKAAF